MKKNLTEKINLFEKRQKLFMPHGIIIANQGEGKHFTAKQEIKNILANTLDDVIIVDLYNDFAFDENDLGYIQIQNIKIRPDTTNCINPLDMPIDDKDKYDFADVLCNKSDMLLDIAKRIGYTATSNDRYLLDMALRKLYSTSYDPNKVPTLEDLLSLLPSENHLYHILYPISNCNCFNQQTNINLTGRVTTFDLSALHEQFSISGAYFTLGYITQILMQRLLSGIATGKRTWIFVSDFDLLVGDERSPYVERFHKTLRKLGGVCTLLISKEIRDMPYYHNPALHTFLMNSLYTIIPKVTQYDMEFLKSMNIDDYSLIPATSVVKSFCYVIGDEYGISQVPEYKI